MNYIYNEFKNIFDDKIKIIIFIYIVFLVKISIIDYSLVPDELKFIEISKSTNWLQSPSPEIFGQLFWLILKLFETIFPSFLIPILLKLFFSSLLLFSFLSCLFFSSNNQNTFYTLAFALTCSYFYWSGKIIGPEVLSTTFIFFSLAALSLSKRQTSYFLIGISIGVKLTALPALFYIFMYDFIINKFKTQKIKSVLLAPVGFFLSNPTDHIYLLERIAKSRSYNDINYIFDYFLNIINKNRMYEWTWDLVLHDNFQVLTFNFIIIFFIMIFCLLKKNVIGLIYLLFFIFQIVFVLKSNPNPFPWYWLTIAPVTIHVFSNLSGLRINIFQSRIINKINLAEFLIFLSLTLSLPVIVTQLYQKQKQRDIISNFGSDMNCIKPYIKKENLPYIIRAGYKTFLNFNLPHISGLKMFDYNLEEKNIKLNQPFLLIISRRFFSEEPSEENSIYLDSLKFLNIKNNLIKSCNNLLLFKIN